MWVWQTCYFIYLLKKQKFACWVTNTVFVLSTSCPPGNSASSVTRWLGYMLIFDHLKQLTFARWHKEFAKICSKCCQILFKPSINEQRFLKFCQSGEYSPNLVTLSGSVISSHNLPIICHDGSTKILPIFRAVYNLNEQT